MQRVTLGGERLGSGNRMKVSLHGYERSTHDLGYLWRSTMSAGTLVPFMSKLALPGDTFDINLNCDIKTHPTIGPLFGSHKVQLDIFLAPIRLYQGMLHNNKLKIGLDMSRVKLPQIELYAVPFDVEDVPDLDNTQVNPSALPAYLGIRGVGTANPANPMPTRRFNAVPILAYWDIYKQYYSNKQEEIGACIHNPGTTIFNAATSIQIRNIFLGTTTTLQPQGTAGPQVNLLVGNQFWVNYTVPLVPDMRQQMINIGDGRRISIYDLTGGAAVDITTAGIAKVTYGGAGYGNLVLDSWQIIQPWEVQVTQPQVQTFALEDIDTMRERILQDTGNAGAFIINNALDGGGNPLAPYRYIWDKAGNFPFMLSSQQALGLKTYQSDLFNNWLQTEWIDGVGGITEVTAIDTTSGSFTIDTLNLSKKVYDMLNRIAVSDGTYDAWLDVQYDHPRIQRAESPIYMGGLIKELVFQEVVSNSATAGEDNPQPLGTLAGKGVMSGKHKGGKVIVKVDEPGYIIGIISITPRIDYSQGNAWDTHLETMDDLHKPALDEIGFQELITEQMAWWSTNYNGTDWITKSAGKQPAWINYMTSVNETRGNFAIATNEMFMTLNRRYEVGPNATGHTPDIFDLTTYIDPVKFNQIFAETALDAQNYWAQIAVDITARRKISAKLMPNL